MWYDVNTLPITTGFADESVSGHLENLSSVLCVDTSHVVKILYVNTSRKT